MRRVVEQDCYTIQSKYGKFAYCIVYDDIKKNTVLCKKMGWKRKHVFYLNSLLKISLLNTSSDSSDSSELLDNVRLSLEYLESNELPIKRNLWSFMVDYCSMAIKMTFNG